MADVCESCPLGDLEEENDNLEGLVHILNGDIKILKKVIEDLDKKNRTLQIENENLRYDLTRQHEYLIDCRINEQIDRKFYEHKDHDSQVLHGCLFEAKIRHLDTGEEEYVIMATYDTEDFPEDNHVFFSWADAKTLEELDHTLRTWHDMFIVVECELFL